MINFEKHKDRILEIYKKGYEKIKIVNGLPTPCTGIDWMDTSNCELKCNNCDFEFSKWCSEEFKLKGLTKREYSFCKAIEEGYIARDDDGTLCYFNSRPYYSRDTKSWDIKDSGDYIYLSIFKGLEFSIVNPGRYNSIEELLEFDILEE